MVCVDDDMGRIVLLGCLRATVLAAEGSVGQKEKSADNSEATYQCIVMIWLGSIVFSSGHGIRYR